VIAQQKGQQVTQINVINLDRSPDRLSAFNANNQDFVTYERFPAIDGKRVKRDEVIRQGILAADNQYIDGAIGIVLSHLSLWQKSIAENTPITVCEDDAILNNSFSSLTEYLMGFCKDNFDVIFWGWNFDAPIFYDLFPHGGKCAAYFNQNELQQSADAFRTAKLYPSLHRVYEAYGTMCYTVSPQGARKLVDLLFPIGATPVFSPAMQRNLDNIGLDIAMNAVHPQISSLVCLPPLAVSKNDFNASTVGSGDATPRIRQTSSFLLE